MDRGVEMNQNEINNKAPELLPIQIRRCDAPFLLNLLSDNAKPWNAELRRCLALFVTNTQAFNAQRELQDRKD